MIISKILQDYWDANNSGTIEDYIDNIVAAYPMSDRYALIAGHYRVLLLHAIGELKIATSQLNQHDETNHATLSHSPSRETMPTMRKEAYV